MIGIIIGNVKVKKIRKKEWGGYYLSFIIKLFDMFIINVFYFF